MRASNRKLDCFDVPTTYVESCDVGFSNGAKTGAVRAGDPRLDAIIDAWPGLTEETREAIADQILGCCTS